MKKLRKLLKTTVKLALFVGLVGGAYYGYTVYTAEEEEGPGDLPTAQAAVRDITVSVSATGVLQPIKIVEVKSKAAGEVIEMPVEMGDSLQKGDLIAQVDLSILSQEMKQAEADHESAKVRLQIADKQYERAKSLHQQDLISENDLETSQQNYTNAEGQLLRFEAALQLAQERLDDATVTAPITGRVIQKAVEEGQIITSSTSNVSGGTTLVKMADLGELEIRTLVDEIDIGTVKPGMEVESTVEAYPDKEFRGTVIKIEPQSVVEQSVTTFPVLSRIDNSDGLLLPGMNADVNIVVHRRPRVLAIPNEAVRTPQDARELADLLGLDTGEGRTLVAEARDAGSGVGPATGRPPAGGARAAADDDGDDHRGARRVTAAGAGPQAGRPPAENGGATDHQLSRPGGEGQGSSTRPEGSRPRPQGGAPGAGEGAGQGRGAFSAAGGGGRGRFAGMDFSDPEVRRRIQEFRRRRQEEAEKAARDPWGIEQVRRVPAVVFVMQEAGDIVARQVVTGVRDWEFTEVVEGLQEGDKVVLLPSTSLLRSQESLRERFRSRSMVPGVGGGRGRGRGH
ncbi:MAG: efflux RND transporter periplasmic adaptor subunit [Acidobacteriota bacterium]